MCYLERKDFFQESNGAAQGGLGGRKAADWSISILFLGEKKKKKRENNRKIQQRPKGTREGGVEAPSALWTIKNRS